MEGEMQPKEVYIMLSAMKSMTQSEELK